MSWVVENLDLIGRLTVEHLRQSALPIVLGLLLSIPAGWFAFRFRLTRGVVLTAVGLLYTIPSLALFALLPPLLGISFLSEVNLIVALTIYAVAIMTRFVADALSSVEPSVRQAADAVGYGTWRRFWQVDLPLAGPVVLAGLRVTAVSTISLCTVGILIGIDNLGYLFTNGYQRQIIPEILAGVVAVVVIALLVDWLLVLAGRALMPWTRKGA
ncbi:MULTISPECIES: ABC transporter permease [Isoptericola]|uniref:ABC transporter permease subunit n=1 Tax=Isoptericola sediminis TaxID=2733572 RepID=A0A849JZS8_9MICO|nr:MULTISPECIES: ABC transporter permease subunit [Isoptericola]MDO8144453.1 ABC transporter permease subunit [Isoptericola sp. 178]MDO8148307.1 ABC transporter permease subunit [Isoptericola sp. b515]MDO8151788.1 ABC transporter permease subunit [Isoptericola sp. b408]NNU28054.1 ABC transporter permease subunit [Isoptericola sediminis]